MDVRSFEDLECYREAREFRRALSALARGLPKRETYLLGDQILRASRSVTANIAGSAP
jgi:four helix bundle protein